MLINLYPLSHELGLKLCHKALKLAVAESCTGGALSSLMTNIPGSSSWFDTGFVTYSHEAKSRCLGVDPETINQYGVVSGAVAQAMAEGALLYSAADLAISLTGVMGPSGGTEATPVGTVWFGLAKKHKPYQLHRGFFEGGRHQIGISAIHFALSWLIEAVDADF